MDIETFSKERTPDQIDAKKRPIRVFLIHQNRLFSEALASCLSRKRDIALVGTVKNLGRALEELYERAVDVVLVDTRIQRTSPHEVIRDIKEQFTGLKVVACGLGDEGEALGFIESGASTYAPLDTSLNDLVKIIRAIDRDQIVCSPRVLKSVLARLHDLCEVAGSSTEERMPDDIRLTPRELEILEQMAAGLRNKEIARELGISLPTVKNHVHRVLDKMSVHRRRDAVRKAYEWGLLDGVLPLRVREMDR